ncbi:Alpha/Beta hydrolase protein [Mycotypha africana]|uniref:Alpha/Beta hydrolase protein n=1 Tax=Mycotypha africana TaxID=64632 RepID=UPI0023017CE1|nr:Alpha/Beta hydrolase protein [Mycotypha africana]KAI8984713.1 Alpha/Beta hydrolase protein [Mycotypha africana]
MSTHWNPLSLSFKRFGSRTHNNKNPLIICHGLFGSKQHWKSLAQKIHAITQHDVWTIDARNHGESPHHPTHDYQVMANDLVHFMNQHELKKSILLGHSMGGKVAMNAALRYPQLVAKLIVVDIPPLQVPLTKEYHGYIKVMKEIQQKRLKRQSEAYDMISAVEPDVGVQHFLLTNLKKNLKKDGIYEFRIPLDILDSALDNLGEFESSIPAAPSSDRSSIHFMGPTLFITGQHSPFRVPFVEYPDKIKAFFPNSTVKEIKGSGHWVQADKPDEFLDTVNTFINDGVE